MSEPVALPHYKLLEETNFMRDFSVIMGHEYSGFKRDIADLNKSYGDVLSLYLHTDYFAHLHSVAGFNTVSESLGVMAPLRYTLAGGRTFEIDKNLNELLEQTDIGNKAPGSSFVLPYPVMYLHFQDSNLEVLAYPTNMKLSGIYVSELHAEDVEWDTRVAMGELGPCRAFEIVLMSEGTKDEPLNSQYLHSRFIIPDSMADDPLEEILSKQMQIYEEMGKRGDGRDYEVFYKAILELDSHLMKCLLFINSDEAILTEINEQRDLERREKQVLNKAKKRKIAQQIRRSYNKILVTHTPSDDDHQFAHEARQPGSKRSHWRRGHFRQQAFGKGRKERRTKWIRPTLITGSKQGQVEEKTYLVK